MKPLLVPAILSAAVFASCGGQEPRRAPAANAKPWAVQTITAAYQEWPELYEATGTVRARTAATIASKVMGYVEQVNVRSGDRVREGQPLVVIDARDLESNLRRASAARAEVQSAMAEAENGIASAKAQFELAQTTFRRMEELAAKKSISTQEFDEASARLKSAQAGYDGARSRRAQLDSKMAQVEQEIHSAEIARNYTRIAAPFAGVVTTKSVEPGNLAAPGAPLLVIEREGEYRLEVPVEESRVSSIRLGTPVQVALEALDRKLDARVSEIAPEVDASSRAYTVKIDLPPSAQLRSGMFGRAIFTFGARKALTVPEAALLEQGQLASLFVADETSARTRLVTAGRRSGNQVEILSGLNPGEKVIVPVPAGLADGARLETRP